MRRDTGDGGSEAARGGALTKKRFDVGRSAAFKALPGRCGLVYGQLGLAALLLRAAETRRGGNAAPVFIKNPGRVGPTPLPVAARTTSDRRCLLDAPPNTTATAIALSAAGGL